MTQTPGWPTRWQLALSGTDAAEPVLPNLPKQERPRIRDPKSREVVFVPSEELCIAALKHHYGWVSLGEDTLRRYRRFSSCPRQLPGSADAE
jgi:hypothetical protein